MKRFEYKISPIFKETDLNEIGLLGWELIQIYLPKEDNNKRGVFKIEIL